METQTYTIECVFPEYEKTLEFSTYAEAMARFRELVRSPLTEVAQVYRHHEAGTTRIASYVQHEG